MTPSRFAQKRFRRRYSFWYNTFCGCILLFALASAVGGGLVGSIVGLEDWLVPSGPQPWWYWVGNGSLMLGVWMLVPSVFVGLVVFTVVALISHRWNARRRWRFMHSMKTGFFFPFVGCLVLTPLAVMLVQLAGRMLLGAANYELDNSMIVTQLLVVLLGPLPLMSRLMYLSKAPQSQHQVLAERLLPLD